MHGLAPFFAQIDALVVPSTGNEGQPTVIIEGMLYGRPVTDAEAELGLEFLANSEDKAARWKQYAHVLPGMQAEAAATIATIISGEP